MPLTVSSPVSGEGRLTVRLGKLPDAASHASPASLAQAEYRLRRHHAGSRVLVAEDEPVSREITAMRAVSGDPARAGVSARGGRLPLTA